jgi:hypothetical protein
MKRLSEDQIKQGVLHADQDVRSACLHYFADCYSRNPTVMPVVVEALERFGRTQAFHHAHPLADLAQTEETIRWVIGELTDRPRRNAEERRYLDILSRLLCHADPQLLQPHGQEILGSSGFSRDLGQRFADQLNLLSRDAAALWRDLEAICEEGKDKVYTKDVRYGEAEQIVEALARDGDRHANRMMAFLGEKVENVENSPLKWLEPLMVRLAGELRHEPAVPLIVAKLHEDAELLSEECLTALVKIGTDGAVRAVRDAYPTAGSHFQLYASGVLGRVHTDLAVQACIGLLEKEPDLELQNWLAQALVDHFSYQGNEVARQVLLDDPDLFDLQRALVPACTLMGQNFPELDGWRKEAEEKMRPKPIGRGVSVIAPQQASAPALVRPRTPPVVADKKVGRNGPCPCGSGKKFKKCCLNKQSLF